MEEKKVLVSLTDEDVHCFLQAISVQTVKLENYLDRISNDIKVIKEAIKTELAHREQEKLDLPFNPILLRKIENCGLSVRSTNALLNNNILYIGDLVHQSQRSLLAIPFLGRKSLNEIKWLLYNMGLDLEMHIPDWNPETLAKINQKIKSNVSNLVLENR